MCVQMCVPVCRRARACVCVYELASGTRLGPTRAASGPTGLTERGTGPKQRVETVEGSPSPR